MGMQLAGTALWYRRVPGQPMMLCLSWYWDCIWCYEGTCTDVLWGATSVRWTLGIQVRCHSFLRDARYCRRVWRYGTATSCPVLT
eukprot:3386683-Rhodomonas_salina.3